MLKLEDEVVREAGAVEVTFHEGAAELVDLWREV